jgi:hypothetical protein
MAMTTLFQLSSSGLANVPIKESRNDFEFIVGDTTYRCPSLIADFLSPRIAALHALDDTISSFVIETKDDDHNFNDWLSLGHGQRLCVTETNRQFQMSISRELGNSEIYSNILKSIEGSISIGNVVGRIKLLGEISANYASEVEFLASHFFEISSSDICELSCDILRQVLICEKLKIESEESSYEIISKGISSDVRYFDLLELIRFEFVSQDCFREYFELVSNSFEYFTISHWISLQSRLLLPVELKSLNDRLANHDFVISAVVASFWDHCPSDISV